MNIERPERALHGGHSREGEVARGFPRAFGRYLLLNAFARGGMGEVYLAKPTGLNGVDRLCVVKTLRPELTSEKGYVNRFLDEARIAVHLGHTNICHVLEVGVVDGEYFLAMEYIPGLNLRKLLERLQGDGVLLPEELAIIVTCGVLDGLDYAHGHRHPVTDAPLHVVHRDVSPQNVVVSYDGEVKLIDFGLAASSLKEEQTESHVVLGKVAYMSPEQARGLDVDGTCDQFAVAVMLTEMLLGERYYGQMSPYAIWQIVGHGTYRPARFDEIDAALRAVLDRALHSEPTERFLTCGSLRDALQELLTIRHPGAGPRALREIMTLRFATDRAREQGLLSRMLAADAEGEASSTALVLEPSDASLPPDGVTEAGLPARALARERETEPTQLVVRAASAATGSRRSFAAAIAAVVVVVAIALWRLAAAGGPAPPAPPPGLARDARADAIAAAPIADPPVAAAPIADPPIAAAPIADPPFADPPAAAVTSPPQAARLEQVSPAADAPARGRPATPRTKPKRALGTGQGASSIDAQMKILEKCPERCAKRVVTLWQGKGDVDPALVRACVDRCIAPR